MHNDQIIRQPGDRRWEMLEEFPLVDRNGVYVAFERRSGRDRRHATSTLKELLELLAQVAARQPGRD